MKLHVLILVGLASMAGHAESKTQLMTPQYYAELCKMDYLVKKAADKKVVEFYNKSRWAIVPAGMSADEVEAQFGVSSLNDLKFVGIQPGGERDVEVNDDESQVYTGATAVYTNKAGTEVLVSVARKNPLIARQISTSSDYEFFYKKMAESSQSKELDAIDSFQVVEVSRDTRDREKFCDLEAKEGLTHFKSK